MDSSAAFNPTKRLKEEFVSNLTGSSMLELFTMTLMLPIWMLFRYTLFPEGFFGYGPANVSGKKKDDPVTAKWRLSFYMIQIFKECIFVFLPITAYTTVISDWLLASGIPFVIVLIISITLKRSGSRYIEEDPNSLRKIISAYRVIVMIITCFCILAVDFKIFPRRLAKTETYGNSLMDVGVGSFVLTNALVSRQARNIARVSWKTALTTTSPLIVLGFGRFLTTTGVDYQVHVGEYGVHWNFFFTLAGISLLTSMINIPPKYSGIVGLLVLSGHQIWLLRGLNTYLLSNERGADLFSQNKEGIFSIIGYWGMYLLSVQLGNYLFFGDYKSTGQLRNNKCARKRVWFLFLLSWPITILLDRHVERVSRRLCNMAYVSLVLAKNLQVLAVLMLSDFIPGHKSSMIEVAVDQNLLATFLLANILTGVVNMSINTLEVSSAMAFSIIFGYTCVLCLTMGLAHFKGIKLKFW